MHEETIKNIIQESFGKAQSETIAKLQERYEKELRDLKQAFDIIRAARDSYVENNRKLIEDKRTLLNTIKNLEEEIKKEKEKQIIMEFQGYFTIRSFNDKYDIKMPSERASVLGKQATRVSQEKRVEVKKVPDWQYGEVNSYREDVLLFVYAEEIKKSTNKLFGREKQILENYEKMMNPFIIINQLKEAKEKETQEELEKREMRRGLREFLFTNYFLNDKNFYVLCTHFIADYNDPIHNKMLGEKRFKVKELVEEMSKLGYEKKWKRVNGVRQQVFVGLKLILARQ